MRKNIGAIDILMLMTPAINESIKNWLEIKTATSNLAANTRAAYRNDVIDFFNFLPEYQNETANLSTVEKLKTSDIRAWQAKLRNLNSGNEKSIAIKELTNEIKKII